MIRLHSNQIFYLDEPVIQEYANVILYSDQKETVHMNPLMLAALQSPLFKSFKEEDDSHVVITEFSREELQMVVDFSHQGLCDKSNQRNIEVLQAFGIDLHTPMPKVKVEIKEEDKFLDDIDDDYKPEASGRSSDQDDFEDFDDDDEDDEERDWIPKPRMKNKNSVNGSKAKYIKKEAKSSSGALSLGEEELERFAVYDFPSPLESYRAPPQTIKLKELPRKNNDKLFKCHQCDRTCSSLQNLKGHEIKYHSEHYNCSKCFKSFALDDVEAFRLHLFKHEYLLAPRPNCCIHCGKKCKINKVLKDHLKRAGPYHGDECVQCPFKFTTYEEYCDHVNKDHFGRWKYRCGHCLEMFDQNKDVKRHYRHVHLGELNSKSI